MYNKTRRPFHKKYLLQDEETVPLLCKLHMNNFHNLCKLHMNAFRVTFEVKSKYYERISSFEHFA